MFGVKIGAKCPKIYKAWNHSKWQPTIVVCTTQLRTLLISRQSKLKISSKYERRLFGKHNIQHYFLLCLPQSERRTFVETKCQVLHLSWSTFDFIVSLRVFKRLSVQFSDHQKLTPRNFLWNHRPPVKGQVWVWRRGSEVCRPLFRCNVKLTLKLLGGCHPQAKPQTCTTIPTVYTAKDTRAKP